MIAADDEVNKTRVLSSEVEVTNRKYQLTPLQNC